MSILARPWFPAALFAGLFLLNACLVSPFIGWYDAGEMVAATACLGVSHPSGQPLYHLLGKILMDLPFPAPILRLGLLSAACGALASVLFYLLARRSFTQGARDGSGGEGVLPLLLTLVWSWSLPWWRAATMVEVYALHLALALGVLWALGLAGTRRWPLVFFLLGLSTVFRPTHHLALPLVGLVLLFEWREGRTFRAKDLFLWTALFGLGRASALYLPFRSALDPLVAHSVIDGPGALLRHLLALGYSDGLGNASWASVGGTLRGMGTSILLGLTPLGAALVGLGFWALLRKKARVPAFLGVALGWGAMEAALVLSVPYPGHQPHQTLLGWSALGLLAAQGSAWVGEWAAGDRARRGAVGAVLAVLVGVQLLSIGELTEHRNDRGAEDHARNVLDVMGPSSLYLPSEENEYFPVVGYQWAHDFRKDVRILPPGTSLEGLGRIVRGHLRTGGSAYLTRKWEGLPAGWGYQPVGPLWKIPPDPIRSAALPPAELCTRWDGLVLGPVRVDPPKVCQGGRIRMTYPWFRAGPGPADRTQAVASLFLREDGALLLRDGVLWLHDLREDPLGPFERLPRDRVRLEERVLFIPSDHPPGRYRLVVGLMSRPPVRTDAKPGSRVDFSGRGGPQNLAKAAGRGGTREWVQFTFLEEGAEGGEFLRVTAAPSTPPDPRFAVAAEFEILPAE